MHSTVIDIEALKYPIGPFSWPEVITSEMIATAIEELKRLPEELLATLALLSEEDLDRSYRPEGWTGRQVVYHLANAKMHAYVRTQQGLTADFPTISYDNESLSTCLPDVPLVPVSMSAQFLNSICQRWTILLETMQPEQFERGFYHSVRDRRITLAESTLMYAWHGKHHVAHLNLLIR